MLLNAIEHFDACRRGGVRTEDDLGKFAGRQSRLLAANSSQKLVRVMRIDVDMGREVDGDARIVQADALQARHDALKMREDPSLRNQKMSIRLIFVTWAGEEPVERIGGDPRKPRCRRFPVRFNA